MKNLKISSIGDMESEIAFVGDFPERVDIAKGQPLSSLRLDYLKKLSELGGISQNAYYTNLCKYRPRGNKLSNLTDQEMHKLQDELFEELRELKKLKVVIPLTKASMYALTGETQYTNMRGSPLKPIQDLGDVVIIPTFHPEVILRRNYEAWPLVIADFAKAVNVVKSGFKWPEYRFVIRPTMDQINKTLDMIEKEFSDKNIPFVVVDVENPHNLLSCIGIAWSREDAICVPFYNGSGANLWSLEQEAYIFRRLANFFLKVDWAGQNALYDWRVLKEHGFTMRTPVWDSMLMHHCLFSELPHKLDVITSIYTNIPYYKTDEDDVKGSTIRAGFEEDHWKYNCFDCISTYWAIEEMKKELNEEDMMKVYMNLYQEMLPIIFKLNWKGIPVDVSQIEKIHIELNAKIEAYKEAIKEETGVDVNPNSSPQVSNLLYNEMGMTKYKGEKTGKKTLLKLAHKYQTEVPRMIVEIREMKRELSLFSEDNIVDGHVVCEYSLGRTNTGRFASRKIRGRGGMNLQNIKKGPQRALFIAPPGYIILSADQKQAEAMFVGWFSRDEKMIALFESGKSLHLENLYNVFGIRVKPEERDSHPLYRIAKGLIHGGNYGLGPYTFARNANIPYRDAVEKLNLYHATYPGIRKVFHAYVENEIRRCRTLYNPFGRREIFIGRIDKSTFLKGYAFMPQSSISDINKQALKFIGRYYRVLMEAHDGLYIAVKETELNHAIEAMREAYDIHFELWGRDCCIPIDISVGPNLNELHDI